MTTITIERSLLERLYLYWLEDADPHELDEFTAQVRAALSAPVTAPVTAPEPVAWLAHYVGRSGVEQEYVSTDKNLADENDASGEAQPLYMHPPATAPEPENDCVLNHICNGRLVHLPDGEQCDRCGSVRP